MKAFIFTIALFLCACTRAGGLEFHSIPRSQGTALQAHADGQLIGERSYEFTLNRAIDVRITAEIATDRPGLEARLAKTGFIVPSLFPCRTEDTKIICSSDKAVTPGTYRITLNNQMDQLTSFTLFVAVQGPGYATVKEDQK